MVFCTKKNLATLLSGQQTPLQKIGEVLKDWTLAASQNMHLNRQIDSTLINARRTYVCM
jgi:hypothetical protein